MEKKKLNCNFGEKVRGETKRRNQSTPKLLSQYFLLITRLERATPPWEVVEPNITVYSRLVSFKLENKNWKVDRNRMERTSNKLDFWSWKLSFNNEHKENESIKLQGEIKNRTWKWLETTTHLKESKLRKRKMKEDNSPSFLFLKKKLNNSFLSFFSKLPKFPTFLPNNGSPFPPLS